MPVVTVGRAGDTTRITLSRAEKANALDAEMVEALLDAVSAAATDGTRFLILDAEGRHFCAGFDLSDLRYSYGLEARFHLPVFQAPMRLIWGRVLDERDDDDINSFQFSIGFPF